MDANITRFCPSTFWFREDLSVDTDVSEEHTASTVNPENDSIFSIENFGMYLQVHTA